MGGWNRSYIDLNDSHSCLSYQWCVIKMTLIMMRNVGMHMYKYKIASWSQLYEDFNR